MSSLEPKEISSKRDSSSALGMYRSGWSYKDANQAHILAITMKQSGLLSLLHSASISSSSDAKSSSIRVQWDPERTILLGKLPYRSLQLGISGDINKQWIEEWIVGIEDITETVRKWKGWIDEGEEGVKRVELEMEQHWKEEVFSVGDQLKAKLGMGEDEVEEGLKGHS